MSQVVSLQKPPRGSTKGTKGEPPAEPSATPNTQKAPSSGSVQLALQVPAETRRAFKAYCAERDITMSDVFLNMWEEYRRTHG